MISVPAARLFEPVRGSSRFLPWILWLAAVLGVLASANLIANLVVSRTKLREANDNLARLARIDALTGIYNRHQTEISLEAALANAQRHGQAFALLMIDVDRFKSINDSHGHQVGDDALRLVASVAHASLRIGDIIGRWGGEEFLAILPCTDGEAARVVAERLRAAVSSTPFTADGHLLPVSVSIGVASGRTGDSRSLVAQADAAMYAAKAAGRDTVAVGD